MLGMYSVVKDLPSEQEALGSIPGYTHTHIHQVSKLSHYQGVPFSCDLRVPKK